MNAQYDIQNPISGHFIGHLTDTVRNILEIVSSTMGPNGQTCILYDGSGVPHVTKDGVTVAEFLQYDTPAMQAVNVIIKETARQTGKLVGDGTTTSIVLACKMILLLDAKAGSSKSDLQNLEKEVEAVIAHIKDNTKHLDKFDPATLDILRSIVYLSSNGDKEVTDLIMEVVAQIGPEGIIDVMTTESSETTINIRDGMMIESPANVHKTYDVTDCEVCLVSGLVEKVHQIKTFLSVAAQKCKEGKTCILIAKEFSKEVRNIVDINNKRRVTSIFLVEVDGFANNMLDILDDMAMILQCRIMSTDNSSAYSLGSITSADFGIVPSAVIGPNLSILHVDPSVYERPEVIEAKNAIVEAIETLKASGDARVGEIGQYVKRLNKFAKSATIKVGGNTSAEAKERKDRVDDAVSALHAAVRGGIVPGAGYALYDAVKSKPVTSMIYTIGTTPATILNPNFLSLYKKGKVEDLRTGEVGDAFDLGIIDPADVQIQAIKQAFTIAKMVIGSRVILTNTPKEWQGMREES